VLRAWVNELDGATPYWPGSPSAGDPKYKHNRKMGNIRGDSHLWQIWYGMRPVSAIRRLPTRFCSEYGTESMPSMHTIRSFTNELFPSLFDPVMQLHQKSTGGNERMLYYILANYRNPAKFEDLVYLSQLVQANTVHFATDFWRRNMGLYNGSLFWQFNDCWPVASWAGIDYHKQLKAVTYHSRHFNKPLCLSNDYYRDRSELYIINELPGFYRNAGMDILRFLRE
jgi:beta-mannosidase